jgi:MYXO-CTERM domain-containing protein
MKRTSLTLAFLVATLGFSHGQILIDGSNYSGLFGPSDSISVTPTTDPPEDGLLGIEVVLDAAETQTATLGNHWSATATGAAQAYLSVLDGALYVPLSGTGAEVALTGSALEFNVDNDNDTLLGALGTGVGLSLAWSATATFDDPGEQLLLAPNTIYQVEFYVNGNDGLLSSTLGLVPQFGIELLDGNGQAVGAVEGGSLVDILGLELLGIIGSPPETKRAIAQFRTGSSVATGPAGIRFTGSALVPATALGLGERFASVSNLSVTQVPEPSALMLAAFGFAAGLRRRR